MKIVYRTDVGKYRDTNEDALCVLTNKFGHTMAVVADGMGGHNAGEVASKIAIDTISKLFKEANYRSIKPFIKDAIAKVNNAIYTAAILNEEYTKMGTTLSIVIMGEERVYTGHVGDSRIYYFNKRTKKGYRFTKDHTVVEALYEQGEITKEEKEMHPYKNVLLQSLGTAKKVTADIRDVKLPEGGFILICSDGLSDVLTDKNLYDYITKEEDLNQKCDFILKEALKNGKDNITFIVIER